MGIYNLSSNTKNILISLCFVLAAILVYFLYHVIAPFLVALVIAYIMEPAVKFLTARKLSRRASVLILFLVCIFTFILIIVPITYSMIAQATDMGAKLKNLTTKNLNEQYSELSVKAKELLKKWLPEYKDDSWLEIVQNTKVQEYIADAVVLLKNSLIRLSTKVFELLGGTFTGVFNLFFIPMLVFYILLDMDDIFNGFKKLIPSDYRPRAIEILNKIDHQLGAMLHGQCIENLIFAILMTIGFSISGLKTSLLLGPIAGIANFIPYLGGFFSAILAFFAAITQGTTSAWLWIGIIATVSTVQFIDCWYLQPRIIGENSGLHPLTIMLALTIAGSLAGIVGMLLAVPVTIIMKVIGTEIYHELYD